MRKKPRFGKCGFSWFAHVGLYVTYVGGKGRSNKQKIDVSENVFFRGLPIGAHFRTCDFFVVCPNGPLCHL